MPDSSDESSGDEREASSKGPRTAVSAKPTAPTATTSTTTAGPSHTPRGSAASSSAKTGPPPTVTRRTSGNSSASKGGRESTVSAAGVNVESMSEAERLRAAAGLAPVRRVGASRDSASVGGGGGGGDKTGRREKSPGSVSSSGMDSESSAYSSLNNASKPLFGKYIHEDSYLACLNRIRVPAWYRKMRPRYRQWLFCLLAEVVIILSLVAQFSFFRDALQRLQVEQVKTQVDVMDMTYNRKLDEAALLSTTWAQNQAVIDYMQGKSSSSAKAVSLIISYDANYLSAEYAIVLNTNATILLDINKNRTGQYFNPHGIVSKVLNNPHMGQLRVAHLVEWAELYDNDAPVYREIYNILYDTDQTHPFDTEATSVMRYIITPVFKFSNGTGPCIGALLVGDLVNGKTTMSFLAVHAFGSGFAGVYTLNTDDPNKNYIRASSETMLIGKYVKVNDLYTAVYDPLNDHIQNNLLKKAAANPGETVLYTDGNYAYAAKVAPQGQWNGTALENTWPDCVFLRALFLTEDPTFTDLLSHTWYFFMVLLLLNIVSVYYSTSTFIEPLEELAHRLKKKEKVDLKTVGNLDLYASWLVRLWLTVGIAVVCSAMSALQIQQRMVEVVGRLATSELGVSMVSYNILVDQMSQNLRNAAIHSEIRSFVQAPNSTTLRNTTANILKQRSQQLKLEFYAMVGPDLKIMASNNHKALGMTLDPSGIVTDTFTYNLRYKKTGVLPYETFKAMEPHVYQKHNIHGMPMSNLDPYKTGANVLVRWSAGPVYAANDKTQKDADAVLLSGDIVNGKPAVCERMLMITKHGFVGIYYHDNGQYNLATSAYVSLDGKQMLTDLDVPDAIVAASAKRDGQTSLSWGTLQGKNFAFAAMEVPKDRYVSAYGQIEINDPPVAFVVYGKDKETTKKIERNQNFWTAFGAILQVAMMLFMNYMAYQPFRKLMLTLEEKGFSDPRNHPTLRKVFRVYVVDATINTCQDLASRPLSESFHKYVTVRVQKAVRRLWRRIKGKKKRTHVKPQNARMSESRMASTSMSMANTLAMSPPL